ncbi:MAG: sulfatase-like hydrolase/transferase [Deltaproteobacteria bacterium]|nr:sulfatase-like hydrolase/transferase [Deltaproteobacteria bacterium]
MNKQNLSPLTFFCNRYLAFFLFLLAYSFVLSLWGGLPPLWSSLRLEAPLLLYGYFLCNYLLKKSRWQPWLAALPIVTAYAIADAYHMAYGRFGRIVEFGEIPELLEVLPFYYVALIGLVGAISFLVLIVSLDWRNWRRGLIASLPALALILVVELAPGSFLTAFQSLGSDVVEWSDALSVGNNGRFTMVAYFEALRKNSIQKTLAFRQRHEYIDQMAVLSQQIKASAKNRNVHLIVLESFLDPKLFSGLKFSQPPTAPAFSKLVGKTDTYSISPVFGGGTAQAEFEVLCGVPAFRALSGVEFTVFTGVKTSCLPSVLDDAGYHTMASNASKPNFFNAIPGYKGTGFQNIFFPKENAPDMDTYLSTGDVKKEWYMFDGNLFSQNLAYVSKYLKDHPGQPIFNYIMSIYGHTPHYMDETIRPIFIKLLSKQKDEQLERAVNQHYYRTEAIAKYVQGLQKIDPHSLIILVSDHVPPLSFGPDTYKKFQYMNNIENSIYYNRIVIIENGKTMQYDTIHHYDVPKLIANYLTDGAYCRTKQCSFAKNTIAGHDQTPTNSMDDYMAIMAHATM